MSRSELTDLGFGEFGVDEVEHTTFTLPDGVRLALRIWSPAGSITHVSKNIVPGSSADDDQTFPAVLEYLPYRKADWTAERDHRRHPWLSSHGYVVVRADMRGSGDSDGVYYDEYLAQENEDACKLIEWISCQSWCNGNVGMYGKSWGGFNGLQVAYLQPPALKAVISLYSTDDRYEDDIHWKGGCVLGGGMLSWASIMFCWDARPPHPRYNQDWRDLWLRRLESAGENCVSKWLTHQTYDHYWRHGSIKEDYTRVRVPVLVMGGWHDGYTNAALRMSHCLPNCRAIIGPWAHNWPDTVTPGPNIAFMDECLLFWDQHLKSEDSERWEKTPRLRWYQCDGELSPGPSVSSWPGSWHSSQTLDHSSLILTLGDQGTLSSLQESETTRTADPVKVSFSGTAGIFCGEWLSFGAPDLANDQRLVSGYHACWRSEPVTTRLSVFGRVEVSIKCRVDTSPAQIYVALCHVMNTGAGGHRLLTYGVKNINALYPDRKLDTVVVHDVTVDLDVIGYNIPGGDSLMLMVSPGSFPTLWPVPEPTILEILSGSVKIPVVDLINDDEGEAFARADMKPRLGPEKSDVEILRGDSFSRDLHFSLSDDTRRISVKTDDGCKYFADVDTETEEVDEDVYTIRGDDPLSAEAYCYRNCKITYQARNGPTPIRTETLTESWMTSTETHFVLKNRLVTKLDGKEFFSKTWDEKVERLGV